MPRHKWLVTKRAWGLKQTVPVSLRLSKPFSGALKQHLVEQAAAEGKSKLSAGSVLSTYALEASPELRKLYQQELRKQRASTPTQRKRSSSL